MSLAKYRKVFKNGIEVQSSRGKSSENKNSEKEEEDQQENTSNDSE